MTQKIRVLGNSLGVLSSLALLLSGCGGGANHGESIGVEPRSVTLSPGETQVFSGGSAENPGGPYYCRLREGDQGGNLVKVTNPRDLPLSPPFAVTYTAPATKGTYHLQVSVNQNYPDGSLTAEATIQVR